jgi:hypothetical protein
MHAEQMKRLSSCPAGGACDGVVGRNFHTRWHPGTYNQVNGEVGFEFESVAAFTIVALGRALDFDHAITGLGAGTYVTLWSVSDEVVVARVWVGPDPPRVSPPTATTPPTTTTTPTNNSAGATGSNTTASAAATAAAAAAAAAAAGAGGADAGLPAFSRSYAFGYASAMLRVPITVVKGVRYRLSQTVSRGMPDRWSTSGGSGGGGTSFAHGLAKVTAKVYSSVPGGLPSKQG